MIVATHISAMLQQDLHDLVVVHCRRQVQRCPTFVDRIHRNTLGEQKPHSIVVPWRDREIKYNQGSYVLESRSLTASSTSRFRDSETFSQTQPEHLRRSNDPPRYP
jgi:hypothetical protein